MNLLLLLLVVIVASSSSTVGASSRCEDERDAAMQPGAVGAFVPRCDNDGSYSAEQCHASTGSCYCARSDGTPIAPPDGGHYDVCQCPRARDDSLRTNRVGVYHPQCQANGKWRASQCNGSTGACWCVDDDTGHKVSDNPADC